MAKPSVWSRLDGWMNTFTGLGTSAKDKRTGNQFQATLTTSETARHLWIGDDTARRAVEILPTEMTREGFEFKFPDDKELQESVEQEWEKLDLLQKLWTAQAYKRAYGGGAIFIGTDDNAATLDEPLDPARVRAITHLTVLEPRELTPLSYYTDPRSPKFGEVEHWQLSTSARGPARDLGTSIQNTHTIHETRLIIFKGSVVSRYDEPEFAGWGHNIFTHLWTVLSDYKIGWESTGVLLQEFSQAVIKIKDLAQIMMREDGKQLFEERLQAFMLSAAVINARVIDADEEYQRHTTDIAGLRDILRAFSERMASALDIPLTLFLGISPGGMNSTGESDIRLFYDRVKALQTRELVPALRRIVAMQLASRGKLDTKAKVRPWSVDPKPLWQESDKEKSESRLNQARADQIYLDADVLSPRQVAESRFAGDDFSFETTVNMAEFDKMEKEREEQREQMAEAISRAPAPPQNPPPGERDAGDGSGSNPPGA